MWSLFSRIRSRINLFLSIFATCSLVFFNSFSWKLRSTNVLHKILLFNRWSNFCDHILHNWINCPKKPPDFTGKKCPDCDHFWAKFSKAVIREKYPIFYRRDLFYCFERNIYLVASILQNIPSPETYNSASPVLSIHENSRINPFPKISLHES